MKRSRVRSAPLLVVAVLSAAVASGCAAVAAAGLGYVISREVLPGTVQQAHVQDEVERVWSLTQESLEVLHDLNVPLVVSKDRRRIQTKVDGSRVTVDVEAFDYMRTVIRVDAEGTLAHDAATAELVMSDILQRLQRES